jgi:hypothetical protein
MITCFCACSCLEYSPENVDSNHVAENCMSCVLVVHFLHFYSVSQPPEGKCADSNLSRLSGFKNNAAKELRSFPCTSQQKKLKILLVATPSCFRSYRDHVFTLPGHKNAELCISVKQQALRKQFEQLAKDDMPMVRSAAFAHLPALAEVFIHMWHMCVYIYACRVRFFPVCALPQRKYAHLS